MIITEKTLETVVIGSGAAGLACALRLNEAGVRTAVVTECLAAGTSRNTGSDKQTYYKLTMAGDTPDSVRAMAGDLFAGGAVDGDTALCEAALSARGFFSLLELGVPFPENEFGEYPGYQTDHDQGRRATSAGPYTSRIMTECLERRLREREVQILEGWQAVKLLIRDGTIRGVLCLKIPPAGEAEYLLIWCKALVLATGGPAGIYRDSVYPASQLGGSGMALEAGVPGKNLTEWQFGMASLRPRWNVSGTYMQAIPRFVSTDEQGENEREFLRDFFRTPGELLSTVFMKGYQWPFDAAECFGGSSLIDLLVYQETVLRRRRVFLDYSRNPLGRDLDAEALSEEAKAYLKKNGASGGKPADRLKKMNLPAYRFYLNHGIDLEKEKLEIAVCVQHQNGGLAADAHWETNISGLFAVGEVCGSHGVRRPGGSALNAGQTGAIRAAACICRRLREEACCREKRTEAAGEQERADLRREAEAFARMPEAAAGTERCADIWQAAAAEMSDFAGMIRDPERFYAAIHRREALLSGYLQRVKRPETEEISLFFRLRDMLTTQRAVLEAMTDYAARGGSRGSALYTDPEGSLPDPQLPELFRCTLDQGRLDGMIQETGPDGCHWRTVRPIPDTNDTFENQWRKYRREMGTDGALRGQDAGKRLPTL